MRYLTQPTCLKKHNWMTSSIYAGIVICLLLSEYGCRYEDKSSNKYFNNRFIVTTGGSSKVSIYIILNLLPIEGKYRDGIAHYAEHLVWSNVLDRKVESINQHSNAWTNDKTIGYRLSGYKEGFPNMLEALYGFFGPISVTTEFAMEERNIILREYEYWRTNNIDAEAHEFMDKFIYKGNAMAGSVLGAPEDISDFDYASAKALHAATHKPDNAVLVVVGNITEREVILAIKKAGFHMSLKKSKNTPPPQFEIAESGTKIFKFHGNNSEPRLLWRKVVTLSKAVDFDLLELQTRLLGTVLEANLPGGFAGALRYDQFIARRFNIHILPLDKHHIELRFEATPDSDVSFQQLQVVFEDALKTAIIGIPEITFKRIKKRLESYWPDWTNDQETADWMVKYVLRRVSNLREPLTKEKLRGLHERLSLDDMNVLLESFQKPGRKAVAFIGKNKGENE